MICYYLLWSQITIEPLIFISLFFMLRELFEHLSIKFHYQLFGFILRLHATVRHHIFHYLYFLSRELTFYRLKFFFCRSFFIINDHCRGFTCEFPLIFNCFLEFLLGYRTWDIRFKWLLLFYCCHWNFIQ